MTLTIAALASGRGSNVAAISRAIDEGRLDAKIALVLSNDPAAGVLKFAQEKNIPVWAHSHKGTPREAFDAQLLDAIRSAGADTIVLAGYMRIVSPLFINAFPGRILNVHPALLPSFPGTQGGADAVAYGVKIAGVTVHFVDEIMDNGPVIIQGAVPVSGTETEETLMQKIHALEHKIYPQALQWLAEDRLHISGRKVMLSPSQKSPSRQDRTHLPPEEKQSGKTMSCGGATLGAYGPETAEAWMVSPALEIF